MRERTELAGGSFSIRSTPGGGTVVTASIPFDPLASGSPMAELGDSLVGLPKGVEPKEESLAEYSSRMSDDEWDFRSRDSTRPRPQDDDRTKVVVVPGRRGSDEAVGSARRPSATRPGGVRQPGAPPGRTDPDGEGVGVGLSDGVGVGVGVGVGDGVGEAEGVGEADGVGDADGEAVAAPWGTTS